MSNTKIVDNLIVGSGLAAFATAMALHRAGASFEVIDVGYDLDQDARDGISELAAEDPGQWKNETRDRLFPAASASVDNVRRLSFGSDFPYRVPEALSLTLERCSTELSHALGGFGNAWGAAMLPYSDRALRNWPIPKRELEASYANVLEYVPLSAEKDSLSENFPLYTDRASRLPRSRQADAFLNALRPREPVLREEGIEFGRARVAVDSSGGSESCRRCGFCLEGCVYGSIFNPLNRWKSLSGTSLGLNTGFFVQEFSESADGVTVTAANVNDGSIKQWTARRLFLAAGQFATTHIIARSLGRFDEPIRILDSQYFFFPLLSYRNFHDAIHFTLAEAFIEICNEQLGPDYIHFQVYGMNRIFAQVLRQSLPPGFPVKSLAGRFYLLQGYLPAKASGRLELSLAPKSEMGEQVKIRGIENPEAMKTARKAKRILTAKLAPFGMIPPFFLKLVPPGRSFHSGGSFPMGGTHPVYSSDALGRPGGLKRVHIVDAANFPDVASGTIGFTIMANADRIARACANL